MAPEQLKVTAIALTVVSLTLFAVAANDFSSPEAPARDPAPDERAGWRGSLTLLALSLGVSALLWGAARARGWNVDRVFWTGTGAFLAILTLMRPWWFWDNHRARWLRRAIGDEPTALFYLAVSAACLWVGLFTDWTFGRR